MSPPTNGDRHRPAGPGPDEPALASVLPRDQARRWRAGERVPVEEYLDRVPGLPGQPEVVLDLIHNEFLLRLELGEDPRTEEYLDRFPGYREQLRDLFAFRPELENGPGPAAVATATMREGRRPDPDPHPADAPAEAPTEAPTRIGRYPVLAEISRGGFGAVYLGRDEELDREVAIKVPHPHRLATAKDAEAFLAEARALARLHHPNILPVYDFGRTDDGRCFLVSKYARGGSLADGLRAGRLPPARAAEVVAVAAAALHYAHKNGLVHRDIKPANILLEDDGRPVVADFGLAMRDEDYGRGAAYAGTPAYMSPEQARGEGHLVDPRTDVYSLGAVLYELLTGRRPFPGRDVTEVLEQVRRGEPRPPRQYDDAIPRELDRICLKAMAKRAADRYPTARDLADDLRQWLDGQRAGGDGATVTPAPAATPAPAVTPAPTPASDQAKDPIVPRGLRSFEPEDADFFLHLVPGPRGRGGVPEVIRFWKARLEETDPDRTFRVGVIYGPSGCGKSSLVKAGLLPRVGPGVTAVYVEATADDTEARVLKELRKRWPGLPAGVGLADALAGVRRGWGPPAGAKLVVVLDQFEQWLHAHPGEPAAALVEAVRQCDGGRVQALLLVRDDFWMGVTRFLREVEVPLEEGRNSAPADLFDPRHARKVLVAFGRAYGALPEGEPTPEQGRFLDQAVAGLAEGGKVVPVRLALFAELVKGKTWTPATWRDLGGAEGVGVAFLEETFGAPTAPPRYRHHQQAARAVLKALLPEPGADLKGPMRSRAELLEASGYARHPDRFDDLLRALDGELRLVTATDRESADPPALPPDADPRYYQLTHDYLVPALRQWLTRKQRETRRGRAELRLAERAGVWAARPENRYLPSWWEWVRIRLLTRRRDWSPPERAMMRRAGRYHGVRAAVVFAALAALGWGGWEYHGRWQARDFRDRLLSSATADVPTLLDRAPANRRWLDPLLREAYAEAEVAGDDHKRLHLSLALLPADPGQLDYLTERLLTARPDEFGAIRNRLVAHRDELVGRLWAELETPHADSDRRFRAAAALAAYAPDDQRWAAHGGFVAAKLVAEPSTVLGQWMAALRPAGRHLLGPLAAFLQDDKWGAAQRRTITALYQGFAGDGDVARLEEALASVDGEGGGPARRKANLGAALVAMGRGDRVWPLLDHSKDPTVRSYLIQRLGPGGADPRVLEARLKVEPKVAARRALVLALGSFDADRSPTAERTLLGLYEHDADPGVRSAAGWVLRKWDREGQLRPVDARLATGRFEGDRQWYLTREGQTMAVVEPGELRVRDRVGNWLDLKVERRFAVATTEVTVEDFRRFCRERKKEYKFDGKIAPDPNCPAISVSWYMAAEYCNWLSDKDGLERCYVPNADGEYAEGMGYHRDYLQRNGYRLPTVDEWHFAAAAGAETRWPWGSQDLVPGYAWLAPGSEVDGVPRTHPVGKLKPNDFGLFDAFGNVAEWCHDEHAPAARRAARADPGDVLRVANVTNRGVCGGGYFGRPANVGMIGVVPHLVDTVLGFRPVRAVPRPVRLAGPEGRVAGVVTVARVE